MIYQQATDRSLAVFNLKNAFHIKARERT